MNAPADSQIAAATRQLTGQRNHRAATAAYLDILAHLPGVKRARFFEIHRPEGVPVQDQRRLSAAEVLEFDRHDECMVPCEDRRLARMLVRALQRQDWRGFGPIKVTGIAPRPGVDRLVLVEYAGPGTGAVALDHVTSVFQDVLILIERAELDPLTMLLNRQAFTDRFIPLLEAERRPSAAARTRTLWLALCDVDYFKRINDTYGHLYGDEILLLFAQLMRRTFRATDLLFRYGGEEFLAVFGTDSRAGAIAALERFRAGVQAHPFPHGKPVTVSIGAIQADPQQMPSTLIDHADKALYEAKARGRNQVIVSDGASALPADGDASAVELFGT
ncbi:MAG: GGDEF domain-containing protein [Gammaproteobacteria bacterium]